MPQYCCVRNCSNTREKGFHLFTFPLKKEGLLKKWITAMGGNYSLKKSDVICSAHFNETDFMKRPHKTGIRLNYSAVPSVFQNELYSNVVETPIPCVMRSILKPKKMTEGKASNMEDKPNEHLTSQNTTIQTEVMEIKSTGKRLMEDIEDGQAEHHVMKRRRIMSKSNINIKMQKLSPRKEKMMREIKTLKQKVKRKDAKIKNLQDLMTELRKKNLMDADPCTVIKNSFEEFTAHLFTNEYKNSKRSKKGNRFSKEIKKFALTLHYYSPKAYQYCRTILRLPHISSLRNWVSSVHIEPGFLTNVLMEISKIPIENRHCNLVFDAMAIRKQIIWDHTSHKFIGTCDYGNGLTIEDSDTPTTEVLVFMLVSIKGKFKWPIGYFYVNKLCASAQVELIKSALILTSSYGIRVWSVTCDGCNTNLSTLTQLGCKLYEKTYGNIKCYFKHPSSDCNVYFVPDVCHNIKLARNALHDYKIFHTASGIISWNHIENLHELQNKMTLKLANKIGSAHIYWKNNAMKVKLAAQTLSSSVAKALEFLQNSNVSQFADVSATVKFISIIDSLFDFLNSRNPFAKGLKKPLFQNNIDCLEQIMIEKVNYLFTIKTANNVPLYSSRKKVFLIGLATAIKSMFEIAKKIFYEESTLKYILTYRFSQDHLEIFFSKIRGRYGWNNNPNVQQFTSAMKQILLHNDITSSASANCLCLDDKLNTGLFKFQWVRKENKESDFNVTQHFNEKSGTAMIDLQSEGISELMSGTTNITQNIIYYIAGFIVRKLITKVSCEGCINSLLNNGENNYFSTYMDFVDVKNNGGLIFASDSTFKVILYTEKLFLISVNRSSIFSKQHLFKSIIHEVRKHFALISDIFQSDDRCLDSTELAWEDSHRLLLITTVSKKYLTIRLHAYAKFMNREVMNSVSKRHRFSKLILFNNM